MLGGLEITGIGAGGRSVVVRGGGNARRVLRLHCDLRKLLFNLKHLILDIISFLCLELAVGNSGGAKFWAVKHSCSLGSAR